MPRAQAGSSIPLETGDAVARLARMIGCTAEQALAEGHRRGTADLARRHPLEATCSSIHPS